MKLRTIFAKNKGKGLHSIQYKGEELSEFKRIIKQWNDISFIRKYCKDNLEYLQSGYFGEITLEEAILEIRQEVNELQRVIVKCKNGQERLSKIFKPLSKDDYANHLELRKDKLTIKHKDVKVSKLRIYAIKVSEDTYVVTGGAIKLVEKMKDHPDTKAEWRKIDSVRDWLKMKEINCDENLIYYYEQEDE